MNRLGRCSTLGVLSSHGTTQHQDASLRSLVLLISLLGLFGCFNLLTTCLLLGMLCLYVILHAQVIFLRYWIVPRRVVNAVITRMSGVACC